MLKPIAGKRLPAQVPSGPYQFQFFTPAEAELIETVMEKIIPQDDHSPGARKARVIEFADLMTATGPPLLKDDWRIGARLLAAELQTRDLDSWLASAAQNESNPQTVLDIFFRTLKQTTINGYYSSAVGIHEELHYQGNTYVAAFVGCDHARA